MTVQTGVGRPDWIRTFATSRFFDLPFFSTTITQQTVLGPYTVVNLDSIGIRFFAHTGHGKLTFEWYQDFALTLLTTGEILEFREGSSIDQSIVVKGSFLKVIADNVEPADWTITLVLYEVPRSVIPQRTAIDHRLIAQIGAAVPVGVTDFDANKVWVSEAVWWVRSALATYVASLRGIDRNGVLHNIDQVTQAENGVLRPTYTLAMPMRISFNNTTGAAGTATFFLLARPGLSGF